MPSRPRPPAPASRLRCGGVVAGGPGAPARWPVLAPIAAALLVSAPPTAAAASRAAAAPVGRPTPTDKATASPAPPAASLLQADPRALSAPDLVSRNLAAGAVPRPGAFLVRTHPSATAASLGAAVAGAGCTVSRQVGRRPFWRLACDPGADPRALAAHLVARSQIRFAEPAWFERDEAVPDDLTDALWHHRNTGQVIDGQAGVPGADLGSVEAWSRVTGQASVVLAIIDNGVHPTHQDLRDRLWRDPQEICGNGVDEDEDGLLDDCAGWDFGDGDADPSPLTLPETRPDGSTCLRRHGTLMAGLAAATGDDGAGVVGVGWGLTVMNLKKHPDDACASTTGESIEAVEYARAHGAQVLVMSFSTSAYSALFEQVLQEADAAGVVSVMSAGNGAEDADLTERYPNHYVLEHGLVVANTDNRDLLRESSNWGAQTVDLAAPGTDLLGPDVEAEDAYREGTGTSYAAPLAAGAVGLVWSAWPQLPASEVVAALREGSTYLPTLDCALETRCVQTAGRLDLPGALAAAGARAGPAYLQVVSFAPEPAAAGPGETVALSLTLRNGGGRDLDAVTALGTAPADGDLQWVRDRVDYGTLLGAAPPDTGDGPLTLEVSAACAGRRQVELEATIGDAAGGQWTARAELELACDVDLDGDGSPRPEDCDDADPQVHPGAGCGEDVPPAPDAPVASGCGCEGAGGRSDAGWLLAAMTLAGWRRRVSRCVCARRRSPGRG